jgi:hypothetical protein
MYLQSVDDISDVFQRYLNLILTSDGCQNQAVGINGLGSLRDIGVL